MINEFRKHIEEIIPLTDEEFNLIESYFFLNKFKIGDFLFQQGEQVPYMYFIIAGLLKLTYNDESGKVHVLSFAMKDWWETDYLAFNNGTKATMSLQCLENSDILSIGLKDYHNLCSAFPKIEHFFLQKATSGHIATQQRILSLLSSSADERLEQLLKRYPSLFQRVSKTLLAAYLGVSRETLSRISSSKGSL